MNSRKLRRLITLALCACMAVSVIPEAGSGRSGGDKDVPARSAPDNSSCSAQNKFAVDLLKGNYAEGANVCVAPLSLYSALAMTQNGARARTREQMSALLGGEPAPVNSYMSWYAASLENDRQLRAANSLWVTDNEELFKPREQFIDTVREHYASDLYVRPFPPDDFSATVEDINAWTSEHTDGMIGQLIDSIPDDTTMYLINTAAFDARWETQYRADQVHEYPFYAADGSEQETDFMFSTENTYISDDMAIGFVKPYENGRYAFAAVLPNEDVTLAEYIDSLTGQRFMSLLASARSESVSAAMPKFEMEYDQEQSGVLKELGMTDAFDDVYADFSDMGTCPPAFNTFIGSVLHKTFIAVDEDGTRAGAASAVEMHTRMTSVMGKSVCLDRPFLYAIIDLQTGVPVFFGTVSSINSK